MRKLLLAVVGLFFLFEVKAQSQIASPKIVNYNSSQYKAGLQNWDVAQDKNGILYFGNNEGLLSFNGSFWKNYPLPNHTIVRSVEVDLRNRIFVGGQDELGYFFPDETGSLEYHSLISLIPGKERRFADVWEIAVVGDEVFFRSTQAIFHYSDGMIKVYKPETSWLFMGAAAGGIYAQTASRGMVKFSKGKWTGVGGTLISENTVITSVLEYSADTLLVTTRDKGLYLLTEEGLIKMSTPLDNVLESDRINCSGRVDSESFIFGTASGGVLIVDKKGKLLQKFSFREGLQKNNVHGVFLDHNGSLWLALEDGIDLVAINSAIKQINPDRNTGYSMHLYENSMYIGTSNGLYSSIIDLRNRDLSLSKGEFKLVSNTKGRVWNLKEINNQLLVGHEEGFFSIDKKGNINSFRTPGSWMFVPVHSELSTFEVFSGSYTGLRRIRFTGNRIEDQGHIDGIEESLRFIAYDRASNTVWASHPYHGVYRINLTSDKKKISGTTLYTKKDGLPSTLYNYLYKIRNKILVATEDGVYEFDEKVAKFQPSPLFKTALKGISIQYLKEDGDGNLWFVSNKKVACIDFSKPGKDLPFTIIYFPELNGKVVGGHECIYPLNRENIFIGGNSGFFHLNYKKYVENIRKPTVLLGQIKVFGRKDSVIFGGYFLKGNEVAAKQDADAEIEIPHTLNSIHFEYSSTLYDQQADLEFSYMLEGFDGDWSSWSEKREKDYTNLSPGTYTFKVKARNNLGSESNIQSYSFTIAPAWYQTIWSYIFYIFIFSATIYLLFKWEKKKHQKEQERLNYLFQLELDRNEKEIVRLKNEKLESEVNFKNRELASMTMHLVQRGEVLVKVKEVVSALAKKTDISDSSGFKQLLRLIREVERTDEDWENFTLHFNTVNADFFDVLKEAYPDLTPNELKLCAYLKMNLSSKEIAQLMNITIKAVEVARYRLRKKLKLSSETRLESFISEIQKKSAKGT